MLLFVKMLPIDGMYLLEETLAYLHKEIDFG